MNGKLDPRTARLLKQALDERNALIERFCEAVSSAVYATCSCGSTASLSQYNAGGGVCLTCSKSFDHVGFSAVKAITKTADQITVHLKRDIHEIQRDDEHDVYVPDRNETSETSDDVDTDDEIAQLRDEVDKDVYTTDGGEMRDERPRNKPDRKCRAVPVPPETSGPESYDDARKAGGRLDGARLRTLRKPSSGGKLDGAALKPRPAQ